MCGGVVEHVGHKSRSEDYGGENWLREVRREGETSFRMIIMA